MVESFDLGMKAELVQKLLFTTAIFLPLLATAQGTFIYDQQSSDESNGGSVGNIIQNAQPTGQSFTPSLDGVGFVRLQLFDQNRSNSLGATVYVNLRSDSITGPIIGTSDPITMPDNFGIPLSSGFVTFFFPATVSIQPGTTYFFQPVVQSGDSWAILAGVFNYGGGAEYAFGSASSSADYWFREGVVVPEPSIFSLGMLGTVGLWLGSRRVSKRATGLRCARSCIPTNGAVESFDLGAAP